jgi:hypothetical protein
MNGTLVVTVQRLGTSVNARGSVLLRVRPDQGRTIEVALVGSARSIDVPAGTGSLQAIFSSGRVHEQTYSVGEGQKLPLDVKVPGSPHESMAWLSVSRDPSPASATRPTMYSATRSRLSNIFKSNLRGAKGLDLAGPGSKPANLTVDTLSYDGSPLDLETIAPPPKKENVEVQTITRDGSTPVVLATDQDYPEVRVCHLHDSRSAEVFRTTQSGSGLALLRVVQPEHPDLVRLCALPGPLGASRSNVETHVALREVAGDALPDVQIVPADGDLAPVVGFLERSNQRALGVLQDELVDWARDAMSDKVSDPIAATIGMAVLLRLGRQETVTGWSANLWRWFPALPDGGALHAAVLTQQQAVDVEKWHEELRSAVLGSCAAGIPLLSDCVRHLRAALTVLRGAEQIDPVVGAASVWCNRLARAMDADSVFTTLTLKSKDEPLVWGFRE